MGDFTITDDWVAKMVSEGITPAICQHHAFYGTHPHMMTEKQFLRLRQRWGIVQSNSMPRPDIEFRDP
jgi:hypothetical protein